jgi:predicted membrane protein
MIIFGIDIRVYFLLFMIYAILGWCMEVTCKLIQYKRFINRGFLIGPYCPIYGYGAILITFLLKKYTNDPIALFFMAIIICGTLEYLTSYFMEKIFKARWWDYSQKKFNINGRVCLNTIIPFGLLGLFIMYVSNPFFISKIEMLPQMWLSILFWALLAIYIVDNIVSGIVIRYVKKTEKIVGKDLDNTEEITKKVKEVLQSKSALHRRLLNAYPSLETVKIKIKAKKEKIKEKVEEQKEELASKVEEQKEELENKIENQKKEIENKAQKVIKKIEDKTK